MRTRPDRSREECDESAHIAAKQPDQLTKLLNPFLFCFWHFNLIAVTRKWIFLKIKKRHLYIERKITLCFVSEHVNILPWLSWLQLSFPVFSSLFRWSWNKVSQASKYFSVYFSWLLLFVVEHSLWIIILREVQICLNIDTIHKFIKVLWYFWKHSLIVVEWKG